ncbi:MAG: choice-of-anchor M domain-containing protein [Propionicimonas sp.]
MTAPRRLRAGLAAIALTLLAGLVSPGSAVAAPTPVVDDTPISFETGHIDTFNLALNADGSARLTLKEDVTGSQVLHTPESVELYVKPAAWVTGAPASFLPPGAPSELYLLPLTQDPNLIWPGWDSGGVGAEYGSDADVDIAISAVTGPGEVYLWTTSAFGSPSRLLVDGWKLPGVIHQTQLAHVHANWGFTAPGTYQLTVRATVTSQDGTRTSTTQTGSYTFVVAERTELTPQPPSQQGNAVTIPGQRGVNYTDGDGKRLAPGVRTLTGELTVTAAPALGFALAADAVRSWTFSYRAPEPTPTPTPSAPVAKVGPSIGGTPVVGGTLTAKPGTWTVAGLTFGYQWLRDGAAISGATKTTYQVASADAGKNLQVRATASKTGLPSGTATSAAVKAGKALTKTPTPTVSGTAKVGKTLKVKAGSWAPSKVTLAYQWLRDGAPIARATKPSYKLTKADAGRKISVRVTGSKSGYVSVAKTSKAKSVAKVKATVKLSVPSKVAKGKQATVKLTVSGAVVYPTGKVTVTVNGKKVTGVLTAAGNGKVSVKLPALKKKGSYKVKASFSPTGETAVSTSKSSTVSKKLKVR